MNRFFYHWHFRKLGLMLVIAINLVLLGEYMYDHSQARLIVGLFWVQSILLGIENVLKMIVAKPAGIIKVNGVDKPVTRSIQIFMALFFCVHFGIFILVFGLIAVLNKNLPSGGVQHAHLIFPAIAMLVLGMALDLPGKLVAVSRRSPGIMTLMFVPYIRLFPFGLIILSDKMNQHWIFPCFLLLKMGAELVYYTVVDRPMKADLPST